MAWILSGVLVERRPIASISAIAACLYAFPVQAAPGEAEFPVTAKVQSSCSLGPQAPPLYLTTTVDSDGKLDPALVNKSLTFEGMICSGPSQITVSATSLRATSPQEDLPPGKSQTINFIATATGWTAIPATVTTLDSSPEGSREMFEGSPQVQYSARYGAIVIHFSGFTVASGKSEGDDAETVADGRSQAQAINGNYSATIKVSLGPVD
jgi:hypothetical protein